MYHLVIITHVSYECTVLITLPRLPWTSKGYGVHSPLAQST
jgi:hypothetical protein